MNNKAIFKRMHKIINNTLGDVCVYTPDGGEPIPDCHIIINRNKPVENDYGVLAGYRIEASILKAEIAEVIQDDNFTDEEGVVWKVGILIKEFNDKVFVEVMTVE